MTTIAYKDGVIACDGRTTQGGLICSDNSDKRDTRDGVSFFFAGTVTEHQQAMDIWFRGDDPECKLDFSAFVVDDEGAVWEFSCGEGGTWRERVERYGHSAIGSGSSHALTAMDCGLSARDAVKMASKRDIYTGGRIRTYAIKK